MGGWVAVVGADDDLELAEHPARLFLVCAQNERPPTRSPYRLKLLLNEVETKVQAGGNKLLDDGAVFLDAVAKTLVGHVEEGRQTPALTTAITWSHCAG